MEQVGEEGRVVGMDDWCEQTQSKRQLTLVADKEKHGETDIVENTQCWVLGEHAVPQPQRLAERELAREEEPDPSAIASATFHLSTHMAHICGSTPSLSSLSHSCGSTRRSNPWIWLHRVMIGATAPDILGAAWCQPRGQR